MKFLLPLFIATASLSAQEAPKKSETPLSAALFIVHEKKPAAGEEVAAAGKSSKGFIAKEPDLVLPALLEVVLLAPKEIKQKADGSTEFVEGKADLLLNLHPKESGKLEALHKKHGECRLYLKVTAQGKPRYFDAEFAPVSDDTLFVEGTQAEKRELATLLQKLVTDPPKEKPAVPNQPKKPAKP